MAGGVIDRTNPEADLPRAALLGLLSLVVKSHPVLSNLSAASKKKSVSYHCYSDGYDSWSISNNVWPEES